MKVPFFGPRNFIYRNYRVLWLAMEQKYEIQDLPGYAAEESVICDTVEEARKFIDETLKRYGL